MQLVRQKYNKIFLKLKTISLDGFFFFFVLLIIILFLSVNVIRVLSSGKSNYETYLYEKNVLEELRQKNRELAQNKEYYSTDEYKKLFLRDTQTFGMENETLYTTRVLPVYYEEEKELLDLRAKTMFDDWWSVLAR